MNSEIQARSALQKIVAARETLQEAIDLLVKAECHEYATRVDQINRDLRQASVSLLKEFQ